VPAALRRRFTPKMQRLLLIGSLSAVLFSKKRLIRQSALTKLNSIMGLCNHEPALLMPMHLSRAIWRGDTGIEVFDFTQLEAQNEAKINEVVQSIFKRIPAWLKYADDD